MQLFLVVGPVVLSDDHAGADGYSVEKQHQGIDDNRGGAYGCQGLFAYKVAYHQHIHGVVKLLEQVAQKKRESKGQQQPGDGPGGHVHGSGPGMGVGMDM